MSDKFFPLQLLEELFCAEKFSGRIDQGCRVKCYIPFVTSFCVACFVYFRVTHGHRQVNAWTCDVSAQNLSVKSVIFI